MSLFPFRYIHAVSKRENVILPPPAVLASVDRSRDALAPYYDSVGISRIVAADQDAQSINASSPVAAAMDANLVALIVLLVLIFFGVVLFSVLCCCMKNWVAKASAADVKRDQQKQRLHDSGSPNGIAGPGSPIYNPASVADEVATSPILSPTPAGGQTDNPLWIEQKFKVFFLSNSCFMDIAIHETLRDFYMPRCIYITRIRRAM